MLRKSSSYFEVSSADHELIDQLKQVAELLSPQREPDIFRFKFDLNKIVKKPLNDLIDLFAKANYELSPSLQRSILKKQGVEKFAELVLRKSDLLLKPTGFLELTEIKPILTYNAKERLFHARLMDYYTITKFLQNKGYSVISHFSLDFSLPSEIKLKLHLEMMLREYQEEALRRWLGSKGRGVLVLPTGAGKTVVALEAIRQLSVKTLIIVPTLDLVSQWREALEILLHVPEVGILGGGHKVVRSITVSTYDSASLMAPKLSTAFGFLVFDEVHHLPSPSYRLAAESSLAPYRLGLTATPERYDELHYDLDRLVGPVLYRIAPKVLERQGYLAPYQIKTIQIALKPEEQIQYDSHMSVFREYTTRLNEIEPSWRFDTIVERTIFDPGARKALSYLEKARRVALEASGKLDQIESLLEQYQDEKVIIFSRYTRIVEKVSDLFGIPLITHKTKASERQEILSKFKDGSYTKIVTGQVLDEGVDVPDASIGIIISGTGSKREFIQRLGRLLRPQKEKAILIELVTESTLENGLARRRRSEDLVD